MDRAVLRPFVDDRALRRGVPGGREKLALPRRRGDRPRLTIEIAPQVREQRQRDGPANAIPVDVRVGSMPGAVAVDQLFRRFRLR